MRRSASPTALLVLLLTASAMAQDLVINNVTLVSPTRGAEPGSVRVEDGVIAEIAPGPFQGASVIDGRGSYLLPGFFDMHVHLAEFEPQPQALETLLRYGVTTARDTGGDDKILTRWREEIAAGERLGPRLFFSGPTVNGPGDNSLNYPVTDQASVEEALDRLERDGFDFVKIHARFAPDVYPHIIEGAHRRGLKVVGHIPRGVTPEEACAAGQDGIEHTASFMEAYATAAPGWTEQSVDYDQALTVMEDMGPALYRCLADAGIMVSPTLGVLQTAVLLEEPELSEFFQQLLPPMRTATRAMRDAGVSLLTATDSMASPEITVPFGETYWVELEQLAEAGLTPEEILRAATRSPAQFLEIDHLVGDIQVGMWADLLILEEDPFEDIANVRSLQTVIKGGQIVHVR